MQKSVRLMQEQKVFEALCPKEILRIVRNYNIPYNHYIKVVNMFQALGFEELSLAFLISHYQNECDRTKSMRKVSSDIFLAEVYKVNPIEYDEKELLTLFINNIESDSLKDLFVKKADYIY